MSATDVVPAFDELGLADSLITALREVGYEQPSPIQAEAIPPLLKGKDLLGQAQTGTGKTAAFALPLLSRIDMKAKDPQLLVLAPTRELAIQVAEAFQSYARYLKNFHVLPIYGGQGYEGQLRQLKRGVQVVVGTPGRVMDHIRRGTLKLGNLQALVLDEADEMLRMGFIDDVEWILEHTPDNRQIALFSATMPDVIRKVANRYLRDPVIIKIANKTQTASTIRQRYWSVSGLHKLDALTRILEVEDFDAMLVFVRTKTATVELAEKLSARGYACEALNGDIAQNLRERIVSRLKSGKLDILVATDVVARGLDVMRISHVLNYDIPYDTESYVHRIGRTGRAGNSGEAILFVSSREKRMLKAIERATRQPIESMEMPSTSDVNRQRVSKFKDRISIALDDVDLSQFYDLVAGYQREHDVDPLQIAAALAHMTQGKEPLLIKDQPKKARLEKSRDRGGDRNAKRDGDRNAKRGGDRNRDKRRDSGADRSGPGARGKSTAMPSERADALPDHPDVPMRRYRIAVGHEHEVKPGNIVGAIANEADIDSEYIGHIDIRDDFALVDLPDEMPKEVMAVLKKTRVCGQKLELEVYRAGRSEGVRPAIKSPAKKPFKKAGDSSKPEAKQKAEKSPKKKTTRKPKPKANGMPDAKPSTKANKKPTPAGK